MQKQTREKKRKKNVAFALREERTTKGQRVPFGFYRRLGVVKSRILNQEKRGKHISTPRGRKEIIRLGDSRTRSVRSLKEGQKGLHHPTTLT